MNPSSASTKRTATRQKKRRSKKARSRKTKKSKQNGVRRIQTNLGRKAFQLSPCSKEYLAVMADPFNPRIVSPCVPDLFDFPSKKVRTLVRGTFFVGTSVGYIAVSPLGSFTNDVVLATATSVGYAAPDIDVGYGNLVNNTTPANTFLVFNSQNPINSNMMIGDNLGYRLVGMGVRARYTGTELNRGGTMILSRVTREPPVAYNTAGYQFQTLLNNQTTSQYPVNRTWRTISWTPKESVEYDFSRGNSTWFSPASPAASYGSTSLFGPDMIIAVSGGVSGNSFDYEIIGYYEYTGQSLDNVSKSESDIVGLSAVRNVVEDQAVVPDSGPGWYDSLAKAVTNIGTSSTSAAILLNAGNRVVNKLLPV